MQIKRVRQEYLSLLYFCGPFLLLGTYAPPGSGMWAEVLIGGGLAMIPLGLYGLLLKKLPWTLPLRIAAGCLAIPLAAFSLKAFAEFLHTCVLPELPPWSLPAVLLAMAVWAAIKGQRTTEGFARLIGPAVLVFFIIVILSAALKIDPQYLSPQKPFVVEMFRSGILFAWLLYFLQGFVLMTVLASRKPSEENPEGKDDFWKKSNAFREIALGMALSILLIGGSLLASVLAMGPEVFEALTFPFYYPPGLARDTEYLERIEILWLAILFFAEFARQATLFTALRKIFKP
ncbi:MAG: hypothetical protein E7224_00560 [Clostridiales bacterium]|nr:hypothetical protein [Clostridiales bacterium]